MAQLCQCQSQTASNLNQWRQRQGVRSNLRLGYSSTSRGELTRTRSKSPLCLSFKFRGLFLTTTLILWSIQCLKSRSYSIGFSAISTNVDSLSDDWNKFMDASMQIINKLNDLPLHTQYLFISNFIAYAIHFKAYKEASKHLFFSLNQTADYHTIARINNMGMAQAVTYNPNFLSTLQKAYQLSENLVQNYLYAMSKKSIYMTKQIVQHIVVLYNYSYGMLTQGKNIQAALKKMKEAQILARRTDLNLVFYQFQDQNQENPPFKPTSTAKDDIQTLIYQLQAELGSSSTAFAELDLTLEKPDILIVKKNNFTQGNLYVNINQQQFNEAELILSNASGMQLDRTYKLTKEMIDSIIDQAQPMDFCNIQQQSKIFYFHLFGIVKKKGDNLKLEIWPRPQSIIPESQVQINKTKFSVVVTSLAGHFRVILIGADQSIYVDFLRQGQPLLKARNYLQQYFRFKRKLKNKIYSDLDFKSDQLARLLQVLQDFMGSGLHQHIQAVPSKIDGLDILELSTLQESGSDFFLIYKSYYKGKPHLNKKKEVSQLSIKNFYNTKQVSKLMLRHYLSMCKLPLLCPKKLPILSSKQKAIDSQHILSVSIFENGFRICGVRVDFYFLEQGCKTIYLFSSLIRSMEYADQLIKTIAEILVAKDFETLSSMKNASLSEILNQKLLVSRLSRN